MNAEPRYTRHFCAVCWEPFYTLTRKSQGQHVRCEKCRALSDAQVDAMPVPVTGIAIRRTCLRCGTEFLARDEAALYCGLYCYASANCRKVGIGKP